VPRPFFTTNQMSPPATEAGAANMKRTLQPNPRPTEFSPFETSLVPFPSSDLVKLSLQVGHPCETPVANKRLIVSEGNSLATFI